MDGYEFKGYFTEDGSKFETTAVIKQNLKLYARFEKKTTSEDGKTTTVETKNSDGTSTETTTKETENGTVTTETKTDSNGNSTTNVDVQTDTSAETVDTVDLLINTAIDNLTRGKADEAIALFNLAYEKDKNNEVAKVFSALADIASISTNKKIGEFFSNHIGITNYPSSLNALISGDWLKAKDYETTETDDFRAYKLSVVENPSEYAYYDYKASKTTVGADDFVDNAYRGKLTYSGKDYWVSVYDKNTVETRLKDGEIGCFPFTVIYYSDGGSVPVKLDENGDYLVRLRADKAGDATPYEFSWDDSTEVEYTYPLTVKAPVFKDLKDADWFTVKASDADYISKLIVANIINGNTKGLDKAIDDIYSALFESDEYIRAQTKIASIKGVVEVPLVLVEGLHLADVFGPGAVKIGASELKLINSALNLFKGIFEFFQSYSLNVVDFSVFKDNFAKLATLDSSEAAMNFALDVFGEYNQKVDPIANGFLSCRSEAKMTASKNTFVTVLGDVVTAYDSITGKDSIYPASISGMVKQGSIARDAANALKDAIENGTKFYVPMDKSIIASGWPTTAGNGCFYVDCKELFTPGKLAIANLIELDEDEDKPVFYADGGKKTKITTAKAFKDLLSAEDAQVYINVKLFKTVSDITDVLSMATGMPKTESVFPVPAFVAAYIYNFYYGGLEEMLSNSGNN